MYFDGIGQALLVGCILILLVGCLLGAGIYWLIDTYDFSFTITK